MKERINRTPFTDLSKNFRYDIIKFEAQQARLKLLDHNSPYLSEQQITGCMLAWFSFNAEFYREIETNSWHIRGDLEDTSCAKEIFESFPDLNTKEKDNGMIFYRGNINFQEDLNNFVSSIKNHLGV